MVAVLEIIFIYFPVIVLSNANLKQAFPAMEREYIKKTK